MIDKKNREHTLYTKLARVYDALYLSLWPYDVMPIDRILSSGGVKTVVDIGCGAAHTTEKLDALGYDIIGTDLHDEMLAIGRERAPHLRLVQQDMRSVDVERQNDAALVLGRAFSYMLTDLDAIKALQAINGSLEPGGLLVFDSFDPETYLSRLGGGKTAKFSHEGSHGDLKVIRDSVAHSLDEERMVWTWDGDYMFTEDNVTRIGHDHHQTRAFSQHHLEEILEVTGFEPIDFDSSAYRMTARKR